METAWIELLKASPIAAAMIITVMVFLKAMGKRDEAFEKSSARWHSSLTEINANMSENLKGISGAVTSNNEKILELLGDLKLHRQVMEHK